MKEQIKKPTYEDAYRHPAYRMALQNATDRATRDYEGSFVVYYDGIMIYVRDSKAARPNDSIIVATVENERAGVVKVRVNGGEPLFLTV